MAQITAALVKELREKTGAGMMDCKKALTEADGDMEAAIDWLRKKGLSAAAKKAGRVAAEGLIGASVEGTAGALVEVNSETDFVGRNQDFQKFVATLSTLALEAGGDVESLKAMSYPGAGGTVSDALTNMIATIGENISVRRTARIAVGQGVVAHYVHAPVATDLGKIGVIVGLDSTGDAGKLRAFGRKLAMHVAAARPEAVTVDGVDSSAVDRERQVLADQARASGKPENIIEKMVEGRLRKYYEEVVLLEQRWMIDLDADIKVKQAVEQAAKEIGAPIAVTDFALFVLGEGVEKQESDFAAEVAATLGQ
ncbi:MAG: elongation factor Ts [Inquilinus sp.]|nr:elongation factor Ts [Inquilinus sp.]